MRFTQPCLESTRCNLDLDNIYILHITRIENLVISKRIDLLMDIPESWVPSPVYYLHSDTAMKICSKTTAGKRKKYL